MDKQLIRDLAITGGIYDCICDPYDKLKNGDHYSSVMIDLERFAELIVKECIDTVQTFRTRMDASNDNIVVALKEHFGVER